MRKRYIIIIVLAGIVVMAGAFFAQATTVYSAQVVAKPSDAAIGIAPFIDRVDFGDVPAGSFVGKEIVLKNEGEIDNSIRVFVLGSIGNMVTVDPSSVTLKAGQSRVIKMSLTMPSSAQPESTFTGQVIILRLPESLW